MIRITQLSKIPFYEKGFTLVEMAMVLAIVALLLTGLVPTISSQLEQQRRSETRKLLADIEQSLIGFTIINGRLPCPAAGSSSTGLEETSGSPATCTLTKGVLPWATLSISEADSWGRRFTYRVSATFADETDGTGASSCAITNSISFQLCSEGNLYVKNATSGTNIAIKVPAVVVSHGPNGRGAYLEKTGILLNDPTPVGDEEENTDDNNTFVSHEVTQDSYDDLLLWISPNILFSRMVNAGKLP